MRNTQRGVIVPLAVVIVVIALSVIGAGTYYYFHIVANPYTVSLDDRGVPGEYMQGGAGRAYAQAIATKDPAYCGKIVSLYMESSDSFRRHCYLKYAVTTKDENICKIYNAFVFKESDCYSMVAAAKNDRSLCDLSSQKWECLSHFVKTAADTVLCDGLSQGLDKDRCYLKYNELANDPQVCARMTEPNIQGRCYLRVALATRNVEYCEPITSTKVDTSRDRCISTFSLNFPQGPSVCEKINSISVRDGCYYDLAVKTKNFSLCSKIQSSAEKTRCDYWANRN